jgi:pyruvyltransferase
VQVRLVMSSNPVKVYWWKDKPNFGDALSKGVVSYVLSRDVVWASENNCDLFGIGSILHRADSVRKRDTRPIAWGSGHTKAVSADIASRVDIIAVRGPITASYLNLKSIVQGDPGLFASNLIGILPEKKYRFGILPNHAQRRDVFRPRKDQSTEVLLIDPSTTDYLSVIQAVASCEVILSSSLHGLIVADSLGIPNFWIDPFGIGNAARLKYFDYALSIERILGTPIPLDAIEEFIAGFQGKADDEIPYFRKIESCKTDLLAAIRASRLGG